MSRVIHFEIFADDPERIVQFYKDTFNWEIKNPEESTEKYWLVTTGDKKHPGINGGIGKAPPDFKGVNNVIGVSSIDEAVAKIESHKGKIIVPKFTIPDVGHVAYFKDPEGNIFGIIEEIRSA